MPDPWMPLKSKRCSSTSLILAGVTCMVVCGVWGCGGKQAEPPAPTAGKLGQLVQGAQAKQVARDVEPDTQSDFEIPPSRPSRELPGARTLGDLTEGREGQSFESAPTILPPRTERLPVIDEERTMAAGIRQIRGKHLTLYTDIPTNPSVDELPTIFDTAVAQWGEYFDIGADHTDTWRMVGYLIQDKTRFVTAGLWRDDLPPFLHGFQRGAEMWVYEQPSDYYRRHLLLHEGTHAFMKQFLGGSGPPWYMEGIAELFGTHRWHENKLSMRWFPESKETTSHWGRIKVLQDEYQAGRGKSLEQIFRYDETAHLQVEPYAWCWAAAAFFDGHHRYRERFLELRKFAPDETLTFSQRFYDALRSEWPHVAREWHVFISNMVYGYDIGREVIQPRTAEEVPAEGVTLSITVDRGWQSSGYRLETGATYKIEARGRYQVVAQPQVWWCEPNGVTIRYHQGQPLGIVLGAIVDETEQPDGAVALLVPQVIGLGGEFPIITGGTLYLRINDSPAELADNAGTVEIQLSKVSAG